MKTKAVDALITPDDDGDYGSHPGNFDLILSTETQDRDGDTLKAAQWEQPLPESIQFNGDHSMKIADTVGSGKPFITADNEMAVKGTWATTEYAQNVRKLVNGGHVRSASVAYHEKNAPNGEPVRELLNGSFVVVPSNPEAKVLASKNYASQLDSANNEFDIVERVKGMAQTIESINEGMQSLLQQKDSSQPDAATDGDGESSTDDVAGDDGLTMAKARAKRFTLISHRTDDES